MLQEFLDEHRLLHQQERFARWLSHEGHVKNALEKGCDWEPYHGFAKSSLPDFTPLAARFGFEKPDDMLNEMVCIIRENFRTRSFQRNLR